MLSAVETLRANPGQGPELHVLYNGGEPLSGHGADSHLTRRKRRRPQGPIKSMPAAKQSPPTTSARTGQ
jgi:hypothetical protein